MQNVATKSCPLHVVTTSHDNDKDNVSRKDFGGAVATTTQ